MSFKMSQKWKYKWNPISLDFHRILHGNTCRYFVRILLADVHVVANCWDKRCADKKEMRLTTSLTCAILFMISMFFLHRQRPSYCQSQHPPFLKLLLGKYVIADLSGSDLQLNLLRIFHCSWTKLPVD
jgi:hypothetical protein